MCKNLLNSDKADLKLVIHSKSCIQSFVFHEISKEEVTRHINAMKTHTAPGLDGISSKFIELTKLIVAPFLVQLFYNCIDQNIFPENINLAIVTPIPKTSSPKSMNDFRPISVLPIFSKIFEKIIAERVMSFIDKNSILTSSQFGFRTSSSAELAVTSIYDELLQHLDDNKLTCSIFLDLRKAFESVDHSILLKNLNHNGFRGNTLKFFESYLKNRKICTKLHDTMPRFHSISYILWCSTRISPWAYIVFIVCK